jgi:hypothetical protein
VPPGGGQARSGGCPVRIATVLLLKLAAQGIALLVLLPWLFRATAGAALGAALAIWLGSFLVGDRIVLPRLGQGAAAAADFLLVVLGLVLLLGAAVTWPVLLVAAVVTAEGALLHRYLAGRGAVRT